jgi:hypothetical protein
MIDQKKNDIQILPTHAKSSLQSIQAIDVLETHIREKHTSHGNPTFANHKNLTGSQNLKNQKLEENWG